MWSYSGDPATSERDQVRFYVQDTDSSRHLLEDGEIDFLLATWMPVYGSTLYVAAVAAEVIAAKYTEAVAVSADGISVNVGDLSSRYNELASSLRDQYKAVSAFAGPELVNALGDEYDPSIPSLVFGLGVMDNVEAGRQDYGDRRVQGVPVETDPSSW